MHEGKNEPDHQIRQNKKDSQFSCIDESRKNKKLVHLLGCSTRGKQLAATNRQKSKKLGKAPSTIMWIGTVVRQFGDGDGG
jgi:hypothetical protein